MNPEQPYRKLPGTRRGLLSNHSLYLGPDHLLVIHNSGYSEEYRRFYYADIQAFVTCVSDRRARHSWGFGGGALLCFFLAAITGASPIFIVPGVMLTVLWGINWMQGGTCDCHIITAASRERLPSLCRIAPTTRALESLRSVIASHQGVGAADRLPGP